MAESNRNKLENLYQILPKDRQEVYLDIYKETAKSMTTKSYAKYFLTDFFVVFVIVVLALNAFTWKFFNEGKIGLAILFVFIMIILAGVITLLVHNPKASIHKNTWEQLIEQDNSFSSDKKYFTKSQKIRDYLTFLQTHK